MKWVLEVKGKLGMPCGVGFFETEFSHHGNQRQQCLETHDAPGHHGPQGLPTTVQIKRRQGGQSPTRNKGEPVAAGHLGSGIPMP